MEPRYNKKRAVVYARYSSHSQTEQSIEGQLRDAHEFAKRNGIIIVNEYIDRAISGTTDDRPAFQRMIRDAEKKQFQLVLVWKLDRYARNRYDAAIYRAKLKACGVSIVSVKEDLDDESADKIILVSLLEGMAEYYSRNLSENVRRGQRESIMKGWFPGGKIPYGYIHVDHHLVPDPMAAPIVREIYDRYISGERVSLILHDLQTRGVLCHGHQMDYTSLTRILSNPVYMGNFRFAGQVVEGCAEAIITEEVFERASVLRAANRRAPAARRSRDVNYLLMGKLFCGDCGKNYAGDSGTARSGERYYYYSCRGRKIHRNCKNARLRKDEIEYFVCKVISDFLTEQNRPCLNILADGIIRELNSGFEAKEVRQLEQRLRSIESQLNSLVDAVATAPESVRGRLYARMDDLEKDRASTDAMLSQKRLNMDSVFTADDILDFLRLMVTDLDKEENRKFIIDKFLTSAYFYSDGRLVVYIAYVNGSPHTYDPDDDPPPDNDPESHGKKIFDSPLPGVLPVLPDTRRGSSLLSYSLPDADKDEPRIPHVFFLRGKLGIVTWITPVRN